MIKTSIRPSATVPNPRDSRSSSAPAPSELVASPSRISMSSRNTVAASGLARSHSGETRSRACRSGCSGEASPMSRQEPDSTTAPARDISSPAAASRRVLPTPLSPTTKTAAVSPCSTLSSAARRTARSSLRPMNGHSPPAGLIGRGEVGRMCQSDLRHEECKFQTYVVLPILGWSFTGTVSPVRSARQQTPATGACATRRYPGISHRKMWLPARGVW